MMKRPILLPIVIAAVALLSVSAAAALYVRHPMSQGSRGAVRTACAAPQLGGSVVNVTLSNRGGSMMMGAGRMGMMSITARPGAVPAGQASFVVTNTGSLTHELVVLPLAPGAQVGQRAVGADNKVDESTSLGEASNRCGAGAGEGISPGSTGWVTLDLPAGRYELVCNIAGHYQAGMSTLLTVA